MAKRTMKVMLWLVTIMVCGGIVFPVTAADFPAKAVSLIVPWAAGGSTDTCMRVLAENAARNFAGQPVAGN